MSKRGNIELKQLRVDAVSDFLVDFKCLDMWIVKK